jgi:branched-chain amino acid transport system permease protein
MKWPPAERAALALGAIALLLVPISGDRFWIQLLAKVMASAIFAMSLDLLVGYTGLVSLAHAAFYGLAGYLLAGLTNELGIVHLAATLPLCLAGVALAALAIGWLSLRTSGVYFIMVTLAFTQMLFYLFNDSARLGGSDGLYVQNRPRLELAGRALLDLGDGPTVYLVIWAALVLVYLFLARLLRAPFGRVLSGIRANEPRMRTLGYATRRYKLVAFVIAGVLAGLAGYLDAALYGFVNPAHLGWRESGLVLMTVLVGGKGTLHGPALGAFLLTFLQYYGERITDHWLAIVGGVLVLVVLALPGGVAGILRRPAPGDARG